MYSIIGGLSGTSGICTIEAYQCDGEDDCWNNADEVGCEEVRIEHIGV